MRAETIAGDPNGNSGQIGYNLDAVGNRLGRTSSVAGVAGQSFRYDGNDRIEGDRHDANGNTLWASSFNLHPSALEGTDAYGSENRLKTRAGESGEAVFIVYDGDGHKVRETVTRNGVATVTGYPPPPVDPRTRFLWLASMSKK